MTQALSIFAIVTAVLVLVGGLAYRRLWLRLRESAITPTGFGVFLAPVLLAAGVVVGAPFPVLIVLLIIAAAAVVYWFDDFRELSARVRMIVSFLTGAAIGAVLFAQHGAPVWMVVTVALAAGATNVVLTNVVNFYDGADLNLATFVALTAGGLLVFARDSELLTAAAIASLAFIVPFALMNSRPRTIYLGDAGSFVFACLWTLIAVIYLRDGQVRAPAAVPLALPVVDTFFVFCIRITEKHDLLTRNYLHLYQKLHRRFGGFFYLLPQPISYLLVLAVLAAVKPGRYLDDFWATVVVAAVVTPAFYFLCRRLFVPKAAFSETGV